MVPDRREQPNAFFVLPDKSVMSMTVVSEVDALCQAARDCKATHFVVVDGHDDMRDVPIWGVFDARHIERVFSFTGAEHNAWSMRDPIKTFAMRDPRPAMMWAIMQQR